MMIKKVPKLRVRRVEKFGDYYYKMMSEKETLDKAVVWLPDGLIKTEFDVDLFLQDNLGMIMPSDGPLWRMYLTNIKKKDGKESLIFIYIAHHSLADGISTACLALAISEEYNRDYYIKTREPSFF